MQATEGQVMDKFQARDCHSSMTINILTVNHGNLTKNPKLDGRELKGMPMKDRSMTRMLLGPSHVLSVAMSAPESNSWQDTSRQDPKTGEPHSECSDVSAAPRSVA